MWSLFKMIRRSSRFIPEPWHCRLVDGWAWLYEKIEL
jgi:hypothetical protein